MNASKFDAIAALLTQATTLSTELEAEARGEHILTGGDAVTPPPLTWEPLAPNCRQHAMQDGKVTGIHITIHALPGARYRCVRCQMLTVDESGGNPNVQVTVLDHAGRLATDRARMGTGYSGQPRFAALLPSGNPDDRFFLGQSGKFTPPALGPLGFVVIDGRGQIISDAVCSWGLPFGAHIGGRIVFQEV